MLPMEVLISLRVIGGALKDIAWSEQEVEERVLSPTM